MAVIALGMRGRHGEEVLRGCEGLQATDRGEHQGEAVDVFFQDY